MNTEEPGFDAGLDRGPTPVPSSDGIFECRYQPKTPPTSADPPTTSSAKLGGRVLPASSAMAPAKSTATAPVTAPLAAPSNSIARLAWLTLTDQCCLQIREPR